MRTSCEGSLKFSFLVMPASSLWLSRQRETPCHKVSKTAALYEKKKKKKKSNFDLK
jgi:hypothetical protein